MLGSLLYHILPPYLLERGSLTEPSAQLKARKPQESSCLCPSPPPTWWALPRLDFCVGDGTWNWGHHACATSALTHRAISSDSSVEDSDYGFQLVVSVKIPLFTGSLRGSNVKCTPQAQLFEQSVVFGKFWNFRDVASHWRKYHLL